MPIRPPWQRWVAETELPPDLGVEEQAWLGIALVLQRAPRWARSAEFAEAIRKWIIATRGIANAPLGAAKDEPIVPKTAPDAPIRELDAQVHVPSDSMRPDEERSAPERFDPSQALQPWRLPPHEALEQEGDSDVPINRIDAEPIEFNDRAAGRATIEFVRATE